MDPNANLEEQRRLVQIIQAEIDKRGGNAANVVGEIDRLMELMDALDVWLMGGGFLPKAWAR